MPPVGTQRDRWDAGCWCKERVAIVLVKKREWQVNPAVGEDFVPCLSPRAGAAGCESARAATHLGLRFVHPKLMGEQ